jgi:hypothetical protein
MRTVQVGDICAWVNSGCGPKVGTECMVFEITRSGSIIISYGDGETVNIGILPTLYVTFIDLKECDYEYI